MNRQLQEIEQSIQQAKEQRAELISRQEHILDDLEAAEQEFWSLGGNLGLNRDEIERRKERLKEIENENKLRAINAASSPMTPLCLCRSLVIEAYNTAKQEEAGRARQYSEPVLSALYSGLIDHFQSEFGKKSLFDDAKAIIDAQFREYRPRSISAAAAALTPMSLSLIEKMINEDFEKAVNLVRHLKTQAEINESERLQLEAHLNSGADQPGAAELHHKIRDLAVQKGRNETEIAKCDEVLHTLCKQQNSIEKKRAQVMLALAAQADANDDNARILQYATITMDVMKEFKIRLQAQKVHQLEANVTQCFQYLAQKQAMITTISIEPDTLDITLFDYDGGILLKEQLSAGEKQMFAISLLWGLALTSGYKLPVIIDTPMARLDSAHRSNFINCYLPNASSQVVVLSTDEEVYGQYLNDIEPYVNTCYTLIYDDAAKCSRIEPGYFGGELR